MRHLLYSLIGCLLIGAAVRAQTIEGDWEGTLKAGSGEFRLALHIKSDGKGGWQATLDSLDQNAMGIPISSINLTDSMLKFELPDIQASYEGKLSADRKTISGNWNQGGSSFPLNFAPAAVRPDPKKRVLAPSDIDGEWEGALDAGAQTLRLILHIVTYQDGVTAKLDSPDQNLAGLPVTAIKREGAKLTFEMKQFAAGFAGAIDKDLKTISGEWSQSGVNMPLTLKRKGAPPTPNKPRQDE